jgi:hypothetical protein
MIERVLPFLIAGCVADGPTRDNVTGDLLEEHAALVVERGSLRADVWLSGQLVRSVAHLSAVGRDDRAAFTPGAVSRFYAVLGACAALGLGLAAASAQLVNAGSGGPQVVALTLTALGVAILAGYLAAAVARQVPLAGALGTAAAAMLAAIATYRMDEVHTGIAVWIGWSLLAVPAILAGALLRVRRTLSASLP